MTMLWRPVQPVFTPSSRLPFGGQRSTPRCHVLVQASNLEHVQPGEDVASWSVPRRALLLGTLAIPAVMQAALPALAAGDFTELESGLKFQDNKIGDGKSPEMGDQVSVHWAGYLKNYQSKRIDNTSRRDEPYEFILGSHQAIPAFEEAVKTMRVGGIRRVIVPGEHPELSYPRNVAKRYDGSKYRLGPQPFEFDGQRGLDFVLDNDTLNDTNRTLLFDIKLLAVRKQSGSRRG